MRIRDFQRSLQSFATVGLLGLGACATAPHPPQTALQCTPQEFEALKERGDNMRANAVTDTGSFNRGFIPIVGPFFAIGNLSDTQTQAAQLVSDAQALDAACKAAGYPNRRNWRPVAGTEQGAQNLR